MRLRWLAAACLLGPLLVLGCTTDGGPKRMATPAAVARVEATTAQFESTVSLPDGIEGARVRDALRDQYGAELTRDGKVVIESRKENLVDRVEVEFAASTATARFYRSGAQAAPRYAAAQVKNVLDTVTFVARELAKQPASKTPADPSPSPARPTPPAAPVPTGDRQTI